MIRSLRTTRTIKVRATGMAAGLLMVPAMADAHPLSGVGDFYSGLLHPLMNIESALLLLAIGLLGVQQQRTITIGLLAATPVALVLGGWLGVMFGTAAVLRTVMLATTVLAGLTLAAGRALPMFPIVALGAAAAGAIGWMNGADMTPEVSAARFVPGLTLGGLLIVIYVIGGLHKLQARFTLVPRVLGSWIAAVGILMLGLA